MYLFGDTLPDDLIDDELEPLAEGSAFVDLTTAGTADAVPAFQWPILPKPWVRKNSFAAKYPSGKQHGALDMGTAGDTVRAAAPGSVSLARDTGDARGKAVVLNLGGGWEIRHYHLASITVSKGQAVTTGLPLGVVGATGLPRNNPHLHFEVRRNGAFFDPTPYLVEPGGLDAVALATLGAGLWWVLN